MDKIKNDNRRSFRDLHGRKVPRPLWQMLPQSVPYAINIDPTNVCNFRCPFCPTGNPAVLAHMGRPRGVMTLHLYQKILGDLCELTRQGGRKITRLQFWKDGEPLLHKQMAEMIHLTKQAAVAESVEMTTNGSLLTADTARS
jgi:molybdenum cofactor biosynthesis enzyme MoaA